MVAIFSTAGQQQRHQCCGRFNGMASKKKRKAPPKRPTTFKWEFDPDIPTEDLLEGRDLRPEGDLQEIVEDFISMLEHGDYLTWEAVVCSEQELPLTKAQKRCWGSC
jgi:hypothetical protein